MLTSSVLNIPHLNVELKVSGLLLIFSVFTALQVGILSGFQQFKEIGMNTLIAGIIGFILQIPLTYYGSLSGALMGLSLNLILFWIFNFLSIRKIRGGKYPIALFSKSSLSELPILWKFSLPTFLIAILMEATRWIANTKLISSSNGFKQMAIFDVSYQWQVSINILPAILAQVALPILSHNVDDKEKYSHIFYKNFKINAIIATSICAVFCLLSPFILSLYGNGYSQSYLVFIYMIICSTLAAVNSAVWQITVASEHMWVNLFINTFWSVALLFSVYMYVNRSGLTAERLSFSYLLAYMAQSILLVVYFFFYQNSVKTKN
jgi:O-antigen/teichoic acid export membrane protein